MDIFQNMIKIDYKNGMGITGLTDEFFCVYLNNLLNQEHKDILLVVNSLYEANHIYSSLQNYTNQVYLFPMDDFLTSEAIATSPELEMTRLEALNATLSEKNSIYITNLMGYLRFLPTKRDYKNSVVDIKINDTMDPKELVSRLIDIGYERQSIVTKTGEIAIRGFVVDLFPITEEMPIRIEFFGDDVESIRYFDIETQKSNKEISSISITPVTEFIIKDNQLTSDEKKQKYLPKYSEVVSFSKYLDEKIVIYKDYNQLETAYDQIMTEVLDYHTSKDQAFTGDYMFSFSSMLENNIIYYLSLNNISSKIDNNSINHYHVQSISNFREDIDSINQFIQNNLNQNKTILICLSKKYFKNILKVLKMKVYETNEDTIYQNSVNLIDKNINEGFIYENYVIITVNELFREKKKSKRFKSNFKYGTKIKNINYLEIGDYVVHNSHGIGIYNGIKVLNSSGMKKDYLEVLYSGNDKLYIPVEKIDLLFKYVGKEGMVPKINKMDSIDWKKTKQRVKQKVADMADRLLKLYAERESKKGFAFSKDNQMMKEFENDFPYSLTKDQQTSVMQIKKDMESFSPMDRLLCGDVGFGKTEVAFRAAMKAILDSKQVLFLCPTTILSSQHYENAKERFKNFPVNIALLNRFTTKKETTRILDGLKDGTIDLVFGTHRLLSKDIFLDHLGLLVIDEEQRFGVAHKEKIKEYKTTVDVLTLTATPIPRTLQMSLVGMRSLSLIESPPVDRYPVQTYVVEENKQVIKNAIYKELSRNGQIFILYNRVEKIESKLVELEQLIPDAKITYAHGQMTKIELENRMASFINNEYDILLCTTIIETGIDIPNVNTLIILDADRFGLSQLYQIRGRVGRSNKFAYAYLMYHPSKVLTETATKRLNVIKEFTELGSGFSIATRDLSIRGAGDILGSEQAGYIDTVGIDLYLKMLDNEINRRKGIEEVPEEEEKETPLISVETHISDSYVEDESLKIEIHRKINEIDSKEKMEEIKTEIEDRFGKVSEEMNIYMQEELFEKQARNLGITMVKETKNTIEITMKENLLQKIDTEALFMNSFSITPMFRFKSKGSSLIIILDTIRLEKHPLYYLIELMSLLANSLTEK